MRDDGRIDRALIGSSADSFIVDVEKGAIRRFAEAIGDATEIYFDEAVARSLGYPGIVAPPTFPTTFRPPSKPAWLRNLEEGRILAGEQGFRYARPIFAGEQLHCALRLSDIQDKQSSNGPMELVVQDLTVTSSSGEMVCVNRRVLIYRGQAAGAAQRGPS
jgi:acyl dehydratase